MHSKENKHHQPLENKPGNETGCWGIGCTALQELYAFVCSSNPDLNIGYYDVKHEDQLKVNNTTLDFNKVHIELQKPLVQHQVQSFLSTADLVLVNGNHKNVSTMLLILDGKKAFKPNTENLKNTTVIFYNDDTKALASELSTEHAQVTLIYGTDFLTINQYLRDFIEKQKAPLYGLILAGGASSRMNQNKSLIEYHHEPQWLHLYKLLTNTCEQTFISCNESNVELYSEKPVLLDVLKGYGPLSGIISALLKFKNTAILVLACDLPLIDESSINQLIEERDASKMATTFLNPESNYLEPLITIYEPGALPVMLSMLSQGYTCPRKMLMQNDIKIIEPLKASALRNINYPEERDQVLQMIQKNEKV